MIFLFNKIGSKIGSHLFTERFIESNFASKSVHNFVSAGKLKIQYEPIKEPIIDNKGLCKLQQNGVLCQRLSK